MKISTKKKNTVMYAFIGMKVNRQITYYPELIKECLK